MLEKLVEQIVPVIVGSILSSGIAVFILKKWIEGTIRHRFDAELIELKNKYSREQAAINTAYSSYVAARAVASEHTQKAVQELWKYFLDIRKNQPQIMHFLDILTKDEIKSLKSNTNPNVISSFRNSSIDKLLNSPAFEPGVDQLRLYVGDMLWSYFFGYRGLVGRIAMIMTENSGLKYAYYLDDPATEQVVQQLLGEDFQAVKSADIGSYHRAFVLIERNFLSEARRIVNGEAEITATLGQAQGILQATSALYGKTL